MKGNQDFDKIFLSKEEIAILERSKYGAIIRSRSVDYLLEIGLMDHYKLSENENKFVITPTGLRYIKYLNDLKKKEKTKQKITSIRFLITNAISLAALIVSIIALTKK